MSLILLLVALAIAGMRPLPPTGSDEGLLLIAEFIVIAIFGNLLGRVAMRIFRRSKTRIFRAYRHD
jgi:NhaP-type Na+/H+ or K+/H+ antiporter